MTEDLLDLAALIFDVDRSSLPELVLDAVGMAITSRKPPAGTVHHTHRGSQLGLNRSSQHLPVPPRWAASGAPSTTPWPNHCPPP
ncbi:hypothetical protein [Geodermatophilus sabuli]|uniref:hypothetical protein n=1 Tax=Geodermatophilus sabuli TaxID=1564158 RepID=UPI00117A54CD|nr:hypothetical protein [Geodermatophilus sabuli]MBB3082261.1 transposase InsO family protein [Geodermatophilus sabuli]